MCLPHFIFALLACMSFYKSTAASGPAILASLSFEEWDAFSLPHFVEIILSRHHQVVLLFNILSSLFQNLMVKSVI